jgi:NADH-quinone oxidoreductase subunit L
MILAVGAVAAGWVGVPAALGGANRIEHFLEPSFTVALPGQAGEPGTPAGGGITQAQAAEAGVSPATGPEAAHEVGRGTERGLMGLASAVSLGGIALAAFFFLRRRDRADRAAARFPALHRLLLNKYYVDEAYDAAIVTPIRVVSEEGLWRGVDVKMIDGAVNGIGAVVQGGSAVLRRLQTGSIRAYAASVLAGVLIILGFYLWR